MRRRLRQLGVGCLVFVVCAYPVRYVQAVEVLASPVLISEVQTGTAASAFDEYVELAVVGDTSIDLSGWRLMYTSGALTLPSAGCQLAQFSSSFAAGSYIFISAKQYVAGPEVVVSATYDNTLCTTNSVLSPSRGIISLLDAAGTIRDQFSYGSVIGTSDTAALAVTTNTRIFERLYNVDSSAFIDTNNSALDFAVLATGNPGVLPAPPAPVEDPPIPPATDIEQPPEQPSDTNPTTPPDTTPPDQTGESTPPPEGTSSAPPQPKTYLPLKLTELFIDPTEPQSDSADEYVELYNPNNEPVSLAGYMIATGSNYTYKHIFAADTLIESGAFLVVTSGDTALALANSGGAARILAPDGSILDETSYTNAKAGQAWARDADGLWQWTTVPTPSASNTIVLLPPVIATAAAAKAKASATKKATASVKKAPAVKKTATKKPAKSKTAVKAAATREGFSSELTTAPTPLPGWVLALIALAALLYGAYEYRYDVANKFWQLRAYRAARARDRR